MTPWREHMLDWVGDAMRLVLWALVMVNLMIMGVFSVFFTIQFALHLWTWTRRVIFPGSW